MNSKCQISDVMAVFSLISQSLRTAEPLHGVLPQSLVGRLMYHSHSHHHMHAHSENDDSRRSSVSLDHVVSIDYMYYAAAVVAMLQLLRVCIEESSFLLSLLMAFSLLVIGRASPYHKRFMWGGTIEGICRLERPIRAFAYSSMRRDHLLV
jgi:hypothetical protein